MAQRVFKHNEALDSDAAYLWYSLCEEWRHGSHTEDMTARILQLCSTEEQACADTLLQKQREFCQWKSDFLAALDTIDGRIRRNGIRIVEYNEVYTSDWYLRTGFVLQEQLARHALLPSEDFEVVLAALFVGSDVFLTTDDKRLMWRGALSLGFNILAPAFCHPSRLRECIANDFGLRSYRKEAPEAEPS